MNFSPCQSFPHLFLGCAYNYIKNPLACIFHTFVAANLQSPTISQDTWSEICYYLAYYRSEYIRLRTDKLSGIEDSEQLNQKHPLLACRLYIYCFLYLVEIGVMKIGISDADYVFDHLHQHYDVLLATPSDITKHILFLFVFSICLPLLYFLIILFLILY